MFNEGHTATGGAGLTRDDLAAEAIRLGRMLVELMPDEPEAAGLLALMLLSHARRHSRVGGDGSLVRLADQDRGRWDPAMIGEGHQLVRRCLQRNRPGPYQVQAAIAAVHADAGDPASTDWEQILALYDQLLDFTSSPVVRLNRAVALAELEGPEAGLAALADLGLDGYHLFHATRGEFLLRLDRRAEAAAALATAVDLTSNPIERRFLQARLSTLT